MMKPFETTSLRFTSLQDLLDFEESICSHALVINQQSLTISSAFTDAEIELAVNGFHAVKIDSLICNKG